MQWLLVRMALWVRRRPSRQFVIAAGAVAVVAAVLYIIESMGYWPDWLSADRMGRRGPAITVRPVD